MPEIIYRSPGSGPIVASCQLSAPNDRNGKPRRLTLGMDATGDVVACAVHGYVGAPSWDCGTFFVTVPPGEYTSTLRHWQQWHRVGTFTTEP